MREQAPFLKSLVTMFGALRSVSFVGVGPGGADFYKAKFQRGRQTFRIMLDPGGKTQVFDAVAGDADRSTVYLILFHVGLSLLGIPLGLVVVYALLRSRRFSLWTAVFLITAVAASVTGFLFPLRRFSPAHAIGFLSLFVLAITILARYRYRFAGRWRQVYVLGIVSTLYLNVFVLVVQLFEKVPALNAIAPT